MNFDSFTSQIPLLTDDELKSLSARCLSLYESRQRTKREKLREELKEKLQDILNEILDNDFILYLDNGTEDFISLAPDDHFGIGIK